MNRRITLTGDDAAIVSRYEAWLRGWGAAESTIHARLIVARKMLREYGIDALTAENLAAFLGNPKLKAWSRATYHANLRDWCAWMVAEGYLDDDPMEAIKQPKRPRSNPRPLSEVDIDRILRHAAGWERDWVLLALYAGLRAHEVAKLRGQDVTTEGIFVIGKGGVPATLPCLPIVREMATRYPSTGYWFPGSEDGHIPGRRVSLRVGDLFEMLGIEGALHRCRHSFATRLLRNGVHIRDVQRLMRHANLETTAAYTAVDEDQLMAAAMTLPPPPETAA